MSWEDYKEGFDFDFCRGLRVVNDTAERGVKLMTDFNLILARREQEKQYVLQVVEQYHCIFPSANKSTLMGE